mmetsp:Transcript_50149/g.68518  ORF Transcript_50149/g.68518 Transcript_50149/m.68518 type:complete len:178 (-) Transcript_50149:2599-3132(-)
MKRAIGEKFGDFLQGLGFVLCGFICAFLRGWNFTLTLVVASPIFIIPLFFYIANAKKAYIVKMAAYGLSAGYAEQALNAIKVVEAFGMEEREEFNYNKYLEISRKTGIGASLRQAFFNTIFNCCWHWYYAYMFAIAAVFVREQINNPLYDRPYTSSDILTCFFGMIIGFMQFGQLSP